MKKSAISMARERHEEDDCILTHNPEMELNLSVRYVAGSVTRCAGGDSAA